VPCFALLLKKECGQTTAAAWIWEIFFSGPRWDHALSNMGGGGGF
jgi:hypothetical protein